MYAIWLQVAIILLLLCKSSPNTKADSVDTMLVFRYKAGENGQESDKYPTSTRQVPDKYPTMYRLSNGISERACRFCPTM